MRILLVEDSEDDALLVQEEFTAAGCDAAFHLVSKRQEAEEALERETWDLVISDYDLGSFQAPDLLSWMAMRRLDIPFLVVSGVLTEDLAASVFKAGAHDFCVKHNLTRLVPAAYRELREAHGRRQKRATEKALRQAESSLRQKEARLREAEKLEAVGKLAGGIAHDFNNLMTAVIGYGHFALSRLEEAHSLRDSLTEIVKAGEQAAQLTQMILAFSQKQMLLPRPVDLNAEIRRRGPYLSLLAGERVEIAWVLDPGLEPVAFDPQAVGQVLTSLVSNAKEAIRSQGRIQIQTGSVHLDGSRPVAAPPDLEGDYAVLTVGDDGVGMGPDVVKRVFEPYFTTKEAATRTGLGLSLAAVHGIVSQSGGRITVESTPGRGSLFTIYLPFPKPAIEDSPPTHQTVLLADKDPESRTSLKRLLEPRGYRIIETEAGLAAHDSSPPSPEPADLVLLNVDALDMPLLDYRFECGERFRSSRVLFLSRQPVEDALQARPPNCHAPVLRNPCSPLVLLRTLQEATGDGPSAVRPCTAACLR